VSKALWIPTAWLFFCLSRSFSQWMGASPTGQAVAAAAYVEGSPTDAAVYAALEVIALIVVITRWRRVGPILFRNWPFLLFFSYAALSISWSDFPFVTFKHWIKGIGDLMMVLIVISEENVIRAVDCLTTRLAFVLVPLSVLFIKYYPLLGRVLNMSFQMEWVGVSTQKNGLGELCDFLGLAILWRIRCAYRDREDPRRKRHLLALSAVFAMIVWLLWMCDSMTSISALIMAMIVMFFLTRPIFQNRTALVHLLVATLFSFTLYALFFQSSGSLLENLGRNPTLTGRTEIWKMALSVPNNRLIGVGYESFWLGSRLEYLWQAFPGFRVNEAHNGYIEILLTLGWTGAVLLGILIAMGYRNAVSSYRRNPYLGSLRIGFFLAAMINALTEAAFRMMGGPWIFFLLATAAVQVHDESGLGNQRRTSSLSPSRIRQTDDDPKDAQVLY